MKKCILITFLVGIICISCHFFVGKNVDEIETFTLEELTNVSKWVILEGSTSFTHEEESKDLLTGKHLYINSKYHFGYAINTKDVLITKTGIVADKNKIYLDYIETEDTDIFSKYNWFADKYSLSEIEEIQKEMKNQVRLKLYDQHYYDAAHTNLIKEVRDYVNYNESR